MNDGMHATVLEKVAEGMTGPVPELFPRWLSLGSVPTPATGNLVNLVAGVRRCGKTYRLFQQMGELLRAGVDRRLMLYFNFDDERLLPFSSDLLDDVITTYEALNPQAVDGCYLFFDEIQEVPNWGVFLRRMVDTRKAVIYVTGSSSRMLSSEMPSEFRGRSITRELFPLSFGEYCAVRGASFVRVGNEAGPFSSEEKAVLRNLLDEYLARGGFPATLGLARSEAFQVLQGYAGQTVARDIVEREGLANVRVAQAFARQCIASSSREVSLNKTAQRFKALGLRVARESLSDLLSYYEESYLVFRLRELSRSLSPNARSADKVYAVDPGLEAAFSPASATDGGQRLETAVFDALRRRCGYFRRGSLTRALVEDGSKKREIDFVEGDALLSEPLRLVQVCVSLRDDVTRKRELRALKAAIRLLGCSEAWIVTMDESGEFETGPGIVHVVPAWEWLLA